MTQPDHTQAIQYITAGLNEILGESCVSTTCDGIRQRVNTSLNAQGEKWTRGMLIRAGRASLYYWMRDNEERYGWTSMDYRLLPFRQKVTRGIDDLTSWWSQSGAGQFTIDSNAKSIVFNYISGDQPVTQLGCCFFMGLIQEYISCLASGKFFPVRELHCVDGESHHHVFEISKTPLD